MDIKIEPEEHIVPTFKEEPIFDDDFDQNNTNNTWNKEHFVEIKFEIPVKQECIVKNEDISKYSQNIKLEKEEEKVKLIKYDAYKEGCSYLPREPENYPTTNSNSTTTVKLPSKTSPKSNLSSSNKQSMKKKKLRSDVVAVIKIENGLFYERNFVCSVCFKIFPLSRLLRQHASSHVKSKLDTKARRICEKQNESVSQKSTNINQKTLICELCPFKTTYLSSLRTHKMTHTGQKPFKCDFCPFESTYSGHLKTHKMSHTGEKPFKCELCGLNFARLSNLKRHKKTHTDEQPHECDLCDFKSAYSSYLKKHKLLHTGEKKYKCDQCSFQTFYLNTFRKHKVDDKFEKLFKCEVCDFSSAYSCHLVKHKKSHEEIEIYHYD